MIIFLYGSDAFRLKQAKEEIINRYRNKYPSGMSLFTIDMSEAADTDILERTLKSPSFFNEHKLVVCTNIFGKKNSAELIADKLGEYSLSEATDITLVAVENMPSKDLNTKHRGLFKTLTDRKNKVQEIEPLQGNELTNWIRTEAKSRGCLLESGALRNLVEIIGNDSWAIINELDKLAGYKTGEIISDDVASLVTAKADLNIFELIDALGAKNQRKALELLYKELATGRDPYYILTMFIYQFRNVLTVKDLQKRGLSGGEIAQKSKLNPFVVNKIAKTTIGENETIKIYGRLLALDTGFKMGKLDLVNSLYNIILS